ncbi:MAG: hypothetical protein AAF542_07235 [Pseudomonadota bacterium]
MANETMTGLALAIVAACITHVGVRHASGAVRWWLVVLSFALLGASFYCNHSFGGFWSGVYTLVAVYFLTCTLTPWLALLLKARHAR